jgi:hypothetical protein
LGFFEVPITTFFDESRNFYFDVDIETKRQISSPGCKGWIPLWAGIANEARALDPLNPRP